MELIAASIMVGSFLVFLGFLRIADAIEKSNFTQGALNKSTQT